MAHTLFTASVNEISLDAQRYNDGTLKVWVITTYKGQQVHIPLDPQETRTLADFLNEAARIAELKDETPEVES